MDFYEGVGSYPRPDEGDQTKRHLTIVGAARSLGVWLNMFPEGPRDPNTGYVGLESWESYFGLWVDTCGGCLSKPGLLLLGT